MNRKALHNGKHLNKQDRETIEEGIQTESSLAEMSRKLGKDPTTIKREIQKHRFPRDKLGTDYPVDCANYPHCKEYSKNGKYCLNHTCDNYSEFKCARRDKSPGACNGCGNTRSCHYPKFLYRANIAHDEYEYHLRNSREGIDTTPEHVREIGTVLAPLLQRGQSPCHICASHPEFAICRTTLYNYIEKGVFKEQGIGPLDLRRQTSMKPRKIPKDMCIRYRVRKDNSYLIGRKYDDYKYYLAQNPEDASYVVQMDTVYNRLTGPFIQTFKFVSFQLQIGIFHKSKNAEDMLAGVNLLEEILGKECFQKYVRVLLTDRGSEFAKAAEMEHSSDDTLRTHVFFCDPLASRQKGSCEQQHTEIRKVLPKKVDMYQQGLIDQNAANLMFSHINSYIVDSLKQHSPLDLASKNAPDLYQALSRFGVVLIPSDNVTLTPKLLKDALKNRKAKENNNSTSVGQ